MNADFPVEMDEVINTIENAEVLTILFPIIRHVLVIDTRTDSETDPMVKVMPIAGSPELRIRIIHRMRPQFPRPDAMEIIPWPKYISSLISLGVGTAIAKRLASTGSVEAIGEFRSALLELAHMEKDEMVRVIKGENYHTIWSSNS